MLLNHEKGLPTLPPRLPIFGVPPSLPPSSQGGHPNMNPGAGLCQLDVRPFH
ncbi:MAG: hypothetical protein ACE5R6_11050 [Candidatus Heimdallarchaeota archaeon]